MGFSGWRRPGPRQLDRRRQRIDRLVLTEHHALEIASQRAQRFRVGLGNRFGRNARHLGDDFLHFLHADHLFAARFRQQHLRGAHLVDHVDGLVGQLTVVDVSRRQFHRGLDGLGGVADLVVFLVIGLQPLQDLDRVRDRRLGHVDLLEPAHKGAVLFEMIGDIPCRLWSRCSAACPTQRRLQQIRGIHRPAAGGAGADHRMDFVDEQDGAWRSFQLLDDRLEAFLEIAAIARAGDQRAHIER